MSIFARRMTFFSFYQSEHKNFDGNGLHRKKCFFVVVVFWPEKSSKRRIKKKVSAD